MDLKIYFFFNNRVIIQVMDVIVKLIFVIYHQKQIELPDFFRD